MTEGRGWGERVESAAGRRYLSASANAKPAFRMFNLQEIEGVVTEREEGQPAAGGASGIVRNQNILYTLPFDAASLGQVLTPVVERVEAHAAETQMLVVAPDAETALTAARVTGQLAGDRGLIVLPATGAARAARLLRARSAHVISGAPAELLGLIQGSTLKLEHVRVLVLAWLDDILATGAAPALEAIMNEVPKDAARLVVVSRATPEVDAFVERYLRRARRVGDGAGEATEPVSVRYVAVSSAARATALRRLLDELDPGSAMVYVRSAEAAEEVTMLRRTLGYGEDDALRIVRGGAGGSDVAPAAESELVVLYDLPGSHQELRSLVASGRSQVVALVSARQLELLRHLAADGEVAPFVLTTAAASARARETTMRDEVRAVLGGGAPAREILALEPLLEEFDGIEIAAAVLRLLELERERARERPAERGPRRDATGGSTAPAPGGEWTQLFVNIGERDGARVGDLVGAITGEVGLTREQIGRVEVRESHSTVQVAASVADRVVERLTGTMIRGRRAAARVDRVGAERAGSGRGERPGRGDRGDRPARGAAGRPPRGDRGDRGPERGGRGAPRGDARGARGPSRGFGDRERGDAGSRGARGARGGPPRRDRE